MRVLLLALMIAAQSASADKYDPARDAEKDIKTAISQAQKSGKRILLEVGGEWCSWCHILHKYFHDNPKLTEARDRSFVTVRINFSPENENKLLLSRYPKIPGYPHFFVLESDGTFLHSQGTSELEEGQGYNLGRVTAFINMWAPGPKK